MRTDWKALNFERRLNNATYFKTDFTFISYRLVRHETSVLHLNLNEILRGNLPLFDKNCLRLVSASISCGEHLRGSRSFLHRILHPLTSEPFFHSSRPEIWNRFLNEAMIQFGIDF